MACQPEHPFRERERLKAKMSQKEKEKEKGKKEKEKDLRLSPEHSVILLVSNHESSIIKRRNILINPLSHLGPP